MAEKLSNVSGKNAEFLPPYADIRIKKKLSDAEKVKLLTTKWLTAHKFEFPERTLGVAKRRMKAYWFDETDWLRYSASTDSVVCAPCVVFRGHEEGKEKAFSSRPVTDWSNVAKSIKQHDKSQEHRNAQIDAENFLLIMKGERKDIRCSVSTQHHELVIKNRIILKSIVETIVLCGKQNIALRGHEEENSNFIAILHDKAQHNEVLKTHLEKEDPKTKYTSPQIQNEIIDVCADMIKKSIIEPCIKSKYFGFIADEATDAATMEQMALCIRYYNIDKKKIKEKFIGFSECESTTGENLANAFISNIREAGLDIQNIRGQGYDGAANMSGCHRGVKTRKQQIVPGAVYTHCKAHNLNLAIIHASKDALVRNMFDVVQQITFHFNYSAKRQRNFKKLSVNRCCIKRGDARTNKTLILV